MNATIELEEASQKGEVGTNRPRTPCREKGRVRAPSGTNTNIHPALQKTRPLPRTAIF